MIQVIANVQESEEIKRDSSIYSKRVLCRIKLKFHGNVYNTASVPYITHENRNSVTERMTWKETVLMGLLVHQ